MRIEQQKPAQSIQVNSASLRSPKRIRIFHIHNDGFFYARYLLLTVYEIDEQSKT